MDSNTSDFLLKIGAIVGAALAGSFLTYKIAKRSNNVKQKKIKVKGNNSKVVGGDDNSQK